MSVRSYNPRGDDDTIAVDTDALEDWPQRIAREVLVPSIAKKTRNALNTVPVYVEQFQRIKTGRRCSCFFAETDPNSVCVLCYGAGIVGGYQKRGTKVDVLDVTTPYTVMCNVIVNYAAQSRPVYFSLMDTALNGSIEFPWDPVRNIGILDFYTQYRNSPENTDITYSIRLDSEPTYVPITESALMQRLTLAKKMWLRVELSRQTINTPIPKYIGMRCSYRVSRITALRCDVPRTLQSKTLEEFGFTNTWTPQQFSFGNDLKTMDNDDFFVMLLNKSRWKVTEWQNNEIIGINTAWDATCRLIQDMQVTYMNVPLGRMDVPSNEMPPHWIRSMQTETEATWSKGAVTHERLPGGKADIERANNLATGVLPEALEASKPIAEK